MINKTYDDKKKLTIKKHDFFLELISLYINIDKKRQVTKNIFFN